MPLKIESAYSLEDLERAFKDCDSLIEALVSIKDYFELINKWLKEKRENQFFVKRLFNSTVEIKLPEVNEKDDVEQIYEILKEIR